MLYNKQVLRQVSELQITHLISSKNMSMCIHTTLNHCLWNKLRHNPNHLISGNRMNLTSRQHTKVGFKTIPSVA